MGSLGWLIVVFVGLLLLTVALAGARSYQDLERARARAVDLGHQIRLARSEIEELRSQAERLETDPETIERAIRAELGLVRPSEIVLVLPSSDDR